MNLTTETRLAVIENRLSTIEGGVKHIDEQVSDNYVTKEKYDALDARVKMIEKILYGFIGLIVVPVIGAVIYLVVGQQP